MGYAARKNPVAKAAKAGQIKPKPKKAVPMFGSAREVLIAAIAGKRFS